MLLHVLLTKVVVLSSCFMNIYIHLLGRMCRAGSYPNKAIVKMVIHLSIKGLNLLVYTCLLTVIVFLTEVSVLSNGLVLPDSLSLSQLC